MSNSLSTLREIQSTLKSKRIILIVLSVFIAGIAALITRSFKAEYETYSKIFPLSINKVGGSSPMDAIKSQFGISDKTDYDKIYNIKELVTSKTISLSVVKYPSKVKKYRTIAHWIIADYNDNLPIWKKKIKYKTADTANIYQDAADMMVKNTTIESDSKTGFTQVKTKAHVKELAYTINKTILTEISAYYIKLVTEKPRTDLYKISLIRDSLKEELYAVERAIAGFQDANQLSIKYSNNIPQAKLMRARAEIEQLYATATTSYQNARFKLLSESPIFQILDQPGEPYDMQKPSTKKMAILALILSYVVLAIFFCRKIFGRMIMEELSHS
ncbi:MAG: hypothetical protein JNJ58_05020 [Chitinophagaceae bacterium]|nr:hypothetical protein [Chitinophagaceae bacterium]